MQKKSLDPNRLDHPTYISTQIPDPNRLGHPTSRKLVTPVHNKKTKLQVAEEKYNSNDHRKKSKNVKG